MQPIKLELNNFSGIMSGSGKGSITLDFSEISDSNEIVALVGPNGAGKTTVMDNLHPYRLMPSRASSPSPGAFSYFDHIEGSNASKFFLWSHCGITYKTEIFLKVSGKTKKTEAYLFVVDGDKKTPYITSDGQPADGKAEVYDHCIEEILGPSELFFTTQFSSQGKKSLSSMKVSEIKDILISILGGEKIKKISEKASEVVKLLKLQLSSLNTQANPHHLVSATEQDWLNKLLITDEGISQLETNSLLIKGQLEDAVKHLGIAQANLSHNESIQSQRDQLSQKIADFKIEGNLQITQLENGQAQTLNQLNLRLIEVNSTLDREVLNKDKFEKALSDAQNLSKDYDLIFETAQKYDATLKYSVNISKTIETVTEKVKPLADLRKKVLELSNLLAKAGADGKAVAEALELVKSTSSLVDKVPCSGMDMQEDCQLLCKAVEAKNQIPLKEIERISLVNVYKKVKAEEKIATSEIERLIEDEKSLIALLDEKSKVAVELNSIKNACENIERIKTIQAEIPQLQNNLNESIVAIDSLSETKNTLEIEIDQLKQNHLLEIKQLKTKLTNQLNQFNLDLSKLPMPVDTNNLQQATLHVENLKNRLSLLEKELVNLKNQKFNFHSELEKVKTAKEFLASLDSKCNLINDQIANWTLLSKAFGNDGIIALSIDDAGPEIAKYANQLLNEFYDGVFQVRLDTQKQSATGLTKETFQIMVQDTLRGRSTEVSLMSGGEKVWVNECVVRAFSLYMTKSTGVDCETLFSDESDGPLDPERKRQYMAMKRKVLKIGGYKREFFITQTPELWEMADHIINVKKAA